MSERYSKHIQLVFSATEARELQRECELTGMKPTDFFKKFCWELAHFAIEEAMKGAEIQSIRPDGTHGVMFPRILNRVAVNTQKTDLPSS